MSRTAPKINQRIKQAREQATGTPSEGITGLSLPSFRENYGAKITEARLARNWTQAVAARHLGMSRRTLNRMEREKGAFADYQIAGVLAMLA